MDPKSRRESWRTRTCGPGEAENFVESSLIKVKKFFLCGATHLSHKPPLALKVQDPPKNI